MPLYDKLLQLLDGKLTSLIDELDKYDRRIIEEMLEPCLAVGKDFDGESSITAIGYNYPDAIDLKLSSLLDNDNDESYQAWLELITQSNGLPSDLASAPPKQGVTYR